MLSISTGMTDLLQSKQAIGAMKPKFTITVNATAVSPVTVTECIEFALDRQMYQASAFQFVLNNNNAAVAPDSTASAYYHNLWLNKRVTVDLGYGTSAVRVFTGLIDSIRMHRDPQNGAVATCAVRDVYKRALDQKPKDPTSGEYSRTFSGQTAQAIFTSLSSGAGWSSTQISTWTSGVTVDEKTFSTESSVADAMTWLDEITGSEHYTDEYGRIYFKKATDRQPEAQFERLVLTNTGWTDLAHDYVSANSDRVTSGATGGGTQYTNTTGYMIETGNPARIARRATCGSPSPTTVYATYVYAAWSYLEGQDISALDYTLSDDDLCRVVIVEGDADGVPVSYNSSVSSTGYGVLAGKAMHFYVPDAVSTTECQRIADRIKTRILQKARRAEFDTPLANPYLQIGDCVRVYERTSTISEIYRIVGQSFQYDGRGLKGRLSTYHYGYTAST